MTPTLSPPRAAVDLEQLFPPGAFAFRMTADAPGFHMRPGDLVIADNAEPGTDELVVVALETGMCVRRIRFGPHTVTLKSGSPAVPDVVMRAELVHVLGRVIGVIRTYAEER